MIDSGLLSYEDLCELIDTGVIEGVTKDKVNSTSIDLSLGGTILYENKSTMYNKVNINKREPLTLDTFVFGTDVFGTDNEFYLYPGQFILAHSRQVFNLPNDISAEYKLKSSLARVGLEHMNAGWCDAGWNGSVLTLEFKNMTQNHILILNKEDPIGQAIFFKHKQVPDNVSYRNRGRYNNDKTVHGIKQ